MAFSNANGLTFGTSAGSIISASYNSTQFQTTGNYLTTARASNDAIGLNTAQSNVTWTVNSAGLSFDARGYAGTGFSGTNISGTVDSNGVSLSVAPGGGAGDGYNILAAGTQTAGTTGTVKFADSNGISFGMSLSTQITASYTVPSTAGLLSAINVSAGTTSSNQSSIGFSNANGMSFGFSGASITGSYTVPTQSVQPVALSGSNGSFTFSTATFGNLNGLSFYTSNGSFVGSYTVPTVTNSAWTVSDAATSGTVGRLAFTNLNGVTLSLSTGAAGLHTIVGSHNGLTTAMASNRGSDFVQANAVFAGTNASGTIASNGISVSVNPAAAGVGIEAGTRTATTAGNIRFETGNGITFGLNLVGGSIMTASHNGITTGRASNDAVGLNTAQTNVTWTVNSGGLSFNANGYAGTATAATNATFTLNSAGLSLSVAAPGAGGGVGIAAGTRTATTANTLLFDNANGITFGLNAVGGSIMTASHNALTTAMASNRGSDFVQATAAFAGTNASGTIASNGISVSVAAPGAAAENNWVNLLGANTSGNTTASGSTLGFSGINLTLSGTNGSVVNISAPATSSIVGASGISISSAGSTYSVGKVLQSTYVPFFPVSTVSQTLHAIGATSASARFFPIFISDNIIFNALRVMHNISYQTSSVSGRQTVTEFFGLYTNNGSSLSLISSNSFSFAVTGSGVSNTVSYPVSTGTGGYTYTTLSASTTALMQHYWGSAGSVGRPIDLQFGNTMSLSSGQYWLGMLVRNSSSSANIGISIAVGGNANALWNNVAPWGISSAAQTTNSAYRIPYAGLGAYTVSQSSMPNGIPINQIAHTQTIIPLMSFLST